MKKIFNSFKKVIATLLVATILCSSTTPNTILPSDTISTYSYEHNDTGKLPRA